MPVRVARALHAALSELKAERQRIDRQQVAIEAALQAIEQEEPRRGSRGGRRKAGRRPSGSRMSPAARKAVSRRMKAYWAKRRAKASKGKAPGRKPAAS